MGHSSLDTEHKVRRCGLGLMPRNFLWLVDALVLLLVGKNAAWSVVHGRYGDASDGALTLAWYGLAAMYAAVAWAAGGRGARQPVAPRWPRLGAAVGAVACAVVATTPGIAGWSGTPVQVYDWMVLAGCFGLCAACVRRPRP